MKICYSAPKASQFDGFRQRLEGLHLELTDPAAVAAGELDCDLCLLVLPDGLEEAVVTIETHRQLFSNDLPLIVSGVWLDTVSVSRLMSAGADDYLPLDTETPQLGLRLHIFVRQFIQRNSTVDHARLDDWLVRIQRLETLASLTGGIAHDYNNLLSAIQGNAELALMNLSLDSAVRHSLAQINSAAHRAAELTRQIQVFRGGGAGSKGIQPLNLNRLIHDMTELLRLSVFRNCRLEYQLDSTLPFTAGAPVDLRGLVMALTIIASEALGRDGGLIQIRTSRRDGDGAAQAAQVVLEVQHISSGTLPAPDHGGAGSGGAERRMAAARVIARKHGTEIGWTPEPSGGIRRVVFAATVGQPANPQAGETFGRNGGSSGTLLLIDDEEAVRVAAHRLLRRAGYTVFEAASGEEGLEVVAQVAAALDAVLVDLNMPGMECRELLEQLRRIRPDLRLIVWSGFPEEAARERLVGSPDFAFIEKPAHLGELAGALQRVLAS